jgi:hypothetical protein
LTEPFGGQIDRAMVYQPSNIPLPAIVINHPTQMVEDNILYQRAEQIADAAQHLLNNESP